MDNKVTKQRISDHLEYDWFKYLLLAAVVIFAVVFAFNQINAERDEENINIFFACYEERDNDFIHTVKTKMAKSDYDEQKYGKNIIQTLSLEFVSPRNEQFSTLLSTHGAISSDVLILGKNSFYSAEQDSYVGAAGYQPFTQDILALTGLDKFTEKIGDGSGEVEFLRIGSDFKRVETGGAVYAVRIDNLANVDKIADFKSLTEDEKKTYPTEFYMVLNRIGVNMGGYSKEKKALNENKQTFFALKTFFEMYV